MQLWVYIIQILVLFYIRTRYHVRQILEMFSASMTFFRRENRSHRLQEFPEWTYPMENC